MNKTLFLDRDGTINIDYGYVHEPERGVFRDGIFGLCRVAQTRGYSIVVVSNQSGVGRGYYTEAEMDACNSRMEEAFGKEGIRISAVYCCTSADDSDPDRKPNPGMFAKAASDLGIDLASSVSLGDSARDAIAASRAGVGLNLLLAPASDPCARTVADFAEAERILSGEGRDS